LDRETHAIRGLFRTLRDQLPAKLAELDAARVARVVFPPGPYTIPSTAKLKVNSQEFDLTAGSRTAAQIATELNDLDPTGWTASADAGGALVLTGNDAPTKAVPSQVLIREASANAALGIVAGDDDSKVAALSDPPVRFLERAPQATDVAFRMSPIVAVRRDGAQWDRPLDSETSQVRVELHVVFPGPMGEIGATMDALRALCGAIYRVVEEGDGRGRNMVGREYADENGMQVVVARPLPLQVEPTVIPELADMGRVPLAQGYPAFEVEVFAPVPT
jgi:hypothetical protein